MTPQVTFVVPTRNSARTLAACLRSIRTQTVPVELIVVDNNSTDSTVALATAVSDAVLAVGPERCAQRNAGAAVASCDIVVFIDSDMVLDPRVAEQILDQFRAHPSLVALVLPEVSFGVGFLARCRVLEKELYRGDPLVEAARAFRLADLREVGGWNEQLTAAEDWDLTDRIVERFGATRVGRISAVTRHDEGQIKLAETFRKKIYYGQWIPLYRAQPTARPLARRSLLSSALLRTPHLACGLAVLKAVEAAGIVLGARRGTPGSPPPAVAAAASPRQQP